MVVDDVLHAYRSFVHKVLRLLLQQPGFLDAVVDLLLLATTSATVHMGGYGGVCQAPARLLARLAQSYPAFAMFFYVDGRGASVSCNGPCPSVLEAKGPFNKMGYMDDGASSLVKVICRFLWTILGMHVF